MKLLLLACSFFAGLVAVIFIADLGWISPNNVLWFKDGDKVLHFALLGTLALLVDLAVLQMARQNAVTMALMASTVIALLSSAEEFSQIWMPSRTPDWYDVFASCAGIVVGTLLALALRDLVRPRRVPKRAPGNTA
jgi:polysaccharide biosynthesis protein VpsQ